jgi:membrane-bound ClpP family serine protease
MEKQGVTSLFTPLDRKYCDWFYYLAVIAFIFMVLTLLGLVFALFSKKGIRGEIVGGAIYTALMYAIFYFQNRLLYGMCVK